MLILSLVLTLISWDPYPVVPGVEIVVVGAVYVPVWTTCWNEELQMFEPCVERYDFFPFADVAVPSSETSADVWHEALEPGSFLAFMVLARRGECWSA